MVRVLGPLQLPSIRTPFLFPNCLSPRTLCRPGRENRLIQVKYLGSMRDIVLLMYLM